MSYSLLDSNVSNGISQTVSGYLPVGKCFSKSIPLYNKEQNKMLEERIVYSHTAWLRKCSIEESRCICLKIKSLKDNSSLLDIFNEIANDLELNSVFYEEINTFNNDYRWDGRIVNMINNSHNMYVWVYYTNEGPKYCVSPVKFPSNSDFVYNSDYNINDVTEALKTNTAAAKDLYYTRTR